MKKIVLIILIFVIVFYLFPSNSLASGSSNSNIDMEVYSGGNNSSKIEVNTTPTPNDNSCYGCFIGLEKESFLNKLAWSIGGGLIGAIIALWLEKFQKPKLLVETGESVNSEHVYPLGYIVPGRWKFFRMKVNNNKLPWYLNWFMARETAESVHALITFTSLNKTMKGRWSRTLELAYASKFDKIKLALYPEPETVFVGDSAILDIFAKHEHDQEAYGWNNEAYLNNWRTPTYKLDPGDYEIEIKLVGTNSNDRVTLRAHVANSIEDTYLRKA